MENLTADARTDQAARGQLPDLMAQAAPAAALLRLMGNEKRLVLLCQLVAQGEVGVNALAASVGLSQPALSQHLALLREHGLVATRKEAQTVFYRLADPKAVEVLSLLHRIYCAPGC